MLKSPYVRTGDPHDDVLLRNGHLCGWKFYDTWFLLNTVFTHSSCHMYTRCRYLFNPC